jgi:hypothetical protein
MDFSCAIHSLLANLLCDEQRPQIFAGKRGAAGANGSETAAIAAYRIKLATTN